MPSVSMLLSVLAGLMAEGEGVTLKDMMEDM
jgi:hypothetical protein